MRLVRHPVLCNYYVTYRCNAKCSFCDIWEKPSPYITPQDVAQNLRDLKRLGVKVIDFTGGEPLLHRQLPEFLALAKQLGFITTVTTNGLLYPKNAEKLRGLVDMLHFSLDSADRATHDRGRGVACYDFVLESIRVAKELGERPDILFTVFRHNLADLQVVYDTITRPNGLMLIINPAFEYGEVETGESLTDAELDFLSAFGKRRGVSSTKALSRCGATAATTWPRPCAGPPAPRSSFRPATSWCCPATTWASRSSLSKAGFLTSTTRPKPSA